MKITKYVISFLLCVLVMFLLLFIRTAKFTKVSDKKIQYDKALDDAIDSAMLGIVTSANGDEVHINKNLLVENYYRSLYASFGAIDSEAHQRMLELYTPVLALIDNDGVYCYYSTVITKYDDFSAQQDTISKVWSPKVPYTITDNTSNSDQVGLPSNIRFTINFTLSDKLQISISGDPIVYEGTWKDLKERYCGDADTEFKKKYEKIRAVLETEYLKEEGYFQLWRDEVVTNTIMDQLGYYVNQHNDIAKMYGEQFTFTLPATSSSDITRAIKSVSFISFFQGYPYGRGTDEVYSNFEISGARVSKNLGYYVRYEDESRLLYYHKPSCSLGSGINDWYSSREECALQGALPCPECNP